MPWHCLHTLPKQENKVSLLLQRDLELEVFAPRIRFRRMRAGHPLWTTEALFPGYLFARFDYVERRRQINALPGVVRIVQFGERVPVLDESLLAELRAFVSDNDTLHLTAEPQPGSEVVITEGALRGLQVLVTRILPARQRIAILLEMLGSVREVEIERDRVLPAHPRRAL